MKFRSYNHERDDKLLKEICCNCGSNAVKGAYAYFRTAEYYCKDRCWCEVVDNDAFYFATKARNHVRLLAIAVRTNRQGEGLGKVVLYRLLRRMKHEGVYTLTFITSMAESAQSFWLNQGAKIMDVKGTDYEMQIKIE